MYTTLKDVLDIAKKQLSVSHIENASYDVSILASAVFRLSSVQLITKENELLETLAITEREIQKFFHYIALRSQHYSVSEILKKKNFYGLDFIVTNDVLTPRPETEILVERSFEYIKQHTVINTILDIGTGSGCIAITLAVLCKKENIHMKIIASDISLDALRIAEKNAKKHGVFDMIEFQHSDLLENINKTHLKNSCIVTNLPYIPNNDRKIMSKEVLQGDPYIALFSGEKGTDLYEKFFRMLFPNKKNMYGIQACFFEFDSGVGTKNIQKMIYQKFLQNIPDIELLFFSDYARCERFGQIVF